MGELEDPQAAFCRAHPTKLQIWWRISASPDELLDLNDASLLDRNAMGPQRNLVALAVHTHTRTDTRRHTHRHARKQRAHKHTHAHTHPVTFACS